MRSPTAPLDLSLTDSELQFKIKEAEIHVCDVLLNTDRELYIESQTVPLHFTLSDEK